MSNSHVPPGIDWRVRTSCNQINSFSIQTLVDGNHDTHTHTSRKTDEKVDKGGQGDVAGKKKRNRINKERVDINAANAMRPCVPPFPMSHRSPCRRTACIMTRCSSSAAAPAARISTKRSTPRTASSSPRRTKRRARSTRSAPSRHLPPGKSRRRYDRRRFSFPLPGQDCINI